MKRYLAVTGLSLMVCALAVAQDNGQRVVVPARNSSRPRQLKVHSLHAAVVIKTHAGKDVIVEGVTPPRRTPEPPTPPGGMRRIDIPAGGFTVEEDDNVITVQSGSSGGGAIQITVPVDTAVQVKSTNGPVSVEGVHGDIDATSTNGPVQILNVSGTVVAESTNGPIKATIDRLDPAKPISFSSTNGSIDVTLPADTKANLKMRSFHGSIWTDFDMKVTGGAQPVSTGGGSQGKFEVKVDRTVYGTINGGGLEASFSTLNGRITIRKK
jgi:hypothetical protein